MSKKKPDLLGVKCNTSIFYVSSDLVTSIGWAGMTLTRRTHGCGPGLGTGSAAEVSVPTFWFLHGVGWTTHSPQGKRIASHGQSPSYPGTSLVGSDVDKSAKNFMQSLEYKYFTTILGY